MLHVFNWRNIMTLNGNLGFIGGGKMGEALIQGILKSGAYSADNILVTDPVEDRREFLSKTYGVSTFSSSDSEKVWSDCETIILAVNPQIMKDVLMDAKNKPGTGVWIVGMFFE